MNIITDLIPISNNRRGTPMVAQYITIHETGNSAVGADAEMHNRYIRSADCVSRPASWHYTVDDHSIYQHIPTAEQAIHAGKLLGNQISIGIEMCINADGNFEQTKKNAQELVTRLLIEQNLTKDKIVQHNHWSGKNCPATIRKTGTWQLFLDGIGGEDMATIAELNAQIIKLTRDGKTLRDALDAERRITLSQKKEIEVLKSTINSRDIIMEDVEEQLMKSDEDKKVTADLVMKLYEIYK